MTSKQLKAIDFLKQTYKDSNNERINGTLLFLSTSLSLNPQNLTKLQQKDLYSIDECFNILINYNLFEETFILSQTLLNRQVEQFETGISLLWLIPSHFANSN